MTALTDCPEHGPMRVTDINLSEQRVTASCKFCSLHGTWHSDAVRIANGLVHPV